jgi:hypothetical protein
MARALSGNRQTAEDFVQETFLRALRHFDSYRGGNFRAWMAAIMRNLHRDRPMTHDMPADKAAMDAPGDFNGWSNFNGSTPGLSTAHLQKPFSAQCVWARATWASLCARTVTPSRNRMVAGSAFCAAKASRSLQR